MTTTSRARTALRIPYTVARAPLAVLDTHLLGRLPDSSRVKTGFSRGLATLDAAAGRLIGDDRLERRGEATSEKIDNLERADQAEAKADALRTQAAETKQNAAAEAEERHKEADAEERERIAAALLEETEATQHVGELAEADLAEQKRQAELRAKHLQREQAEQARAKERRIAVEKANKTAPAKKQLKAAARTQETARAREAKADKLDALAETEKSTRRE
jgi:hypothetical protein